MQCLSFPGGTSGKEPTCQCRRHKRCRFDPWVRKIPWRRMPWQPTPVFLPGESHGQRSLADYSPWGCKESDTTERLTLYTLLKVISKTLGSTNPYDSNTELGWYENKHVLLLQKHYLESEMKTKSSQFAAIFKPNKSILNSFRRKSKLIFN